MTALLADATNLGLARMARSSKIFSHSKLLWIAEWHVRDETYKAGLASLEIREHYTDTVGAIEHVFGLCHLLGFRFAPRIRDLADRRLYVADARAVYTALNPMIGGVLDFRGIGENWNETLRCAASIKAGTVAPSALMRRLAAYPKQNAQAKTLRSQ
jgi:TnpA family transposase